MSELFAIIGIIVTIRVCVAWAKQNKIVTVEVHKGAATKAVTTAVKDVTKKVTSIRTKTAEVIAPSTEE